ncbi:MAG: hypothetical protein ACR2HA_10530 [Nocardioides sp.]
MSDAPGEPAEGRPSDPSTPSPGYGRPSSQGAPPPVYGYVPPPGYPPGYVPGYVHVPVRPSHPESTKALVLGIVSLMGGLTCYLPMLLGPSAWIVGRRVVRRIDEQPGRWDGRAQALAGYVMGVIATVLLVLGVLALIGLIAILVFAEGSSDEPLRGRPL